LRGRQGLLALQENRSWDLLVAMAPALGVETATRRARSSAAPLRRKRCARRRRRPQPTRELFDTLLLWRGRVALDANGEARIDVPLNDSLTSFRLVAIAEPGRTLWQRQRQRARHAGSADPPGIAPLARQATAWIHLHAAQHDTPR